MTMRYAFVFLIVGVIIVSGVGATMTNVSLSVVGWQCDPENPEVRISFMGNSDWSEGLDDEYLRFVVSDDRGVITTRDDKLQSVTFGMFEVVPLEWTIPLDDLPQSNPVMIEIVDIDENSNPIGGVWGIQEDSPCVAGAIHTDQADVAIGTELVVYFMPFGDMHIYGIDENGNGYLAEVVTAEMIDSLPPSPVENLLVVDSWAGFQLYRLTTGYWQINLDPEENGDVSVTVFDPPMTETFNLSFNVYDIEN